MISDREIERLGIALGLAHRQGSLLPPDVDLLRIELVAEASAIQDAAALAHGGERVGYALAATTPLTARLLGCSDPVFGPIFADRVLSSGDTFPLTRSIIGVGAQLTFVFGRNLEIGEHSENFAAIADAVASCHLSLQVVGRRVPHAVPLNDVIAWADFGLVEAVVQGPSVPDWHARLHADMEVTVGLDGHVCATGRLFDTMGHPLAPIAWLVRSLADRGKFVEAGDLVAVGSCTGLLQVRPVQIAGGDFRELGSLDLILA